MVSDTNRAATLGQVIKKARTDLRMSQRDVEQSTQKEISNAYLSQLESGKIAKPSPHVLRTLSEALQVPYDSLMERAGYMAPKLAASGASTHSASYSVGNLTASEESALLDYLSYLRSRK